MYNHADEYFYAAVIGAPITNLISYAGTSDLPDYIPWHFGGEIWQEKDLLMQRSPVLNIKYTNTPILLLHGENDSIVPIGQSYEFLNAYKRNSGKITMLRYKSMGHVPDAPAQMKDIMIKTVEWLQKNLNN